jgi:hypothetical protein
MEENLHGIRANQLTNKELARYIWVVGPEKASPTLIKELLARFEAMLDDGK